MSACLSASATSVLPLSTNASAVTSRDVAVGVGGHDADLLPRADGLHDGILREDLDAACTRGACSSSLRAAGDPGA